MDVFYERDADLALIRGRRVLLVGYGSQGRTHALNLRDSGVADVRVALHAGARSAERARADGFEPLRTSEAVRDAEVVVMAAPDEVQPGLYAAEIEPGLRAGAALLFIHGLTVNFGLIKPPPGVDVVLVCPKGAGSGIRAVYERGGGVFGLIAVHQDASGGARGLALAYAAALGCGRAGIIPTTFRDECECDLFGEQAVLCGGIPELIRAAWETLVEAGYPPEVAWFETLHEAKLVTDLIFAHGVAGMLARVSNTAEYGAYLTGPRLIGAPVREALRRALAEVRDGSFVDRLMADFAAGRPDLLARRAAAAAHPIETTDRALAAAAARAP
ncbi:MAG: ketol-acid reductoisomerase [Pseudomonadota bacterium]|nr:ketol-acid reductoisomerase [Pseudomonadota bacterium]